MKKLKIKSLYSIIMILTISFLIKYINKPVSKYNGNETKIYGVITDCQNKEDKTILTVNGREKILVNYYNNYKCKLGKKIIIKGKLQKPSNNTIFYLFNYKSYLLSQKINYILIANKIKTQNNKIKLKYKIKNKIINHIDKYKSKDYLKAFIISDKSEINNDIKESFQTNGISHLLSISKLHISIISIILMSITKVITKNKTISYLITMYFLIFYLFITNYSPSTIRATITLILTTIKKEFKIKIKTKYILIIILLTLLNINPYYINNLGFILSFIISFYLIIFNDIIRRNKNYLRKTLVISIISFVSSMPIIINTYFKINIISPIINIIFVPLITIIIYPLALLTVIIKPLDIIFYKFIKIMELSSQKIENLNIFVLKLPHINIYFFIMYYIVITFILYIWLNKKKNYLWIVIIIIFFHKNINLFDKSVTITYMNVNQGDSILIKNKENILIDTGGDSTNKNDKTAEKKIIPYLNAKGIYKLHYLIITHGDFDHMGEAINLVNNFKVEKVIFNCGAFNDLEKELIKVLDKKKIKYYSCIKELNIDKNKLYFLQTKEYDNENDNSNVIYTEINGYKFMFMGDASSTTEKEILNKYNLPDIDVLKVGHHGSKTSSSKEFLNEINPKYSVISVGKNNRYGHPNKEVLYNLEKSKIYRTDEDGSIMFKIKNNKLKIETCAS